MEYRVKTRFLRREPCEMTNPEQPSALEIKQLVPNIGSQKKALTALHKIEGDRRFHATILDNIKDSVIAMTY